MERRVSSISEVGSGRENLTLKLTRSARFALKDHSAAELLFGPNQARALMCLAVSGVTCHNWLKRDFPFDAPALWHACERLAKRGIVMFGPPARRRADVSIASHGESQAHAQLRALQPRGRFVALDPRFAVARELRDLMLLFAAKNKIRAPRRARSLPSLPSEQPFEPDVDGLDCLFSTPERTTTILSIEALGSAAAYPLSFIIGLSDDGLFKSMSDLNCVGILTSRRDRLRRKFQVDTKRPWSRELKVLLRAMLRERLFYAALPSLMHRRDWALDLGGVRKAPDDDSKDEGIVA